MTTPYRSGDHVVSATRADDGVRVIHLVTHDNGESWRPVQWKPTERTLDKQGSVPRSAQSLIDADYANALYQALAAALRAPSLAVTLTGVSGTTVTIDATAIDPHVHLDQLRDTFGKGELAALAALCFHLATVMDQAGAPPGHYADSDVATLGDDLASAVAEAHAAADQPPPPPAPYSP